MLMVLSLLWISKDEEEPSSGNHKPIFWLDSCYRHFCALQHEAWNVNNLRDPKSINMLFLPLEEQGQQTTAIQISSPPETAQNKSIQDHVNCSMGHLHWMSSQTLPTCAECQLQH